MDIKTYISSGVIEAYAMGNLSVEESSILECVMKNNAEVKQAVFEAQQIFEKLATEQAVEPPSHLKAEILKKITFENPTVSEGKIIPLSTEIKTQTGLPNWAKVAAAVLILGSGYLGFEVNSKNAQISEIAKNNTELSNKMNSMEAMNSMLMNSKKIELKGVEKHPDMLAEVFMDKSDKVYLNIKNLPKAPEGKQYQLWAIVDGKPVDMGMYDTKKGIAIQEMKSVNKPQAFAITLEKEGGNPTPTMEEMYVMGTV